MDSSQQWFFDPRCLRAACAACRLLYPELAERAAEAGAGSGRGEVPPCLGEKGVRCDSSFSTVTASPKAPSARTLATMQDSVVLWYQVRQTSSKRAALPTPSPPRTAHRREIRPNPAPPVLSRSSPRPLRILRLVTSTAFDSPRPIVPPL